MFKNYLNLGNPNSNIYNSNHLSKLK